MRAPDMLGALRERRFRLLWLGQSTSALGDALVPVALARPRALPGARAGRRKGVARRRRGLGGDPDRLRGRGARGRRPGAALEAGAAAARDLRSDAIGVSTTLWIAAGVTVVSTLAVLSVRDVRELRRA